MRKRDLSPRSDQVFVVIVCVRDVVFEAVVFLRIEGHIYYYFIYESADFDAWHSSFQLTVLYFIRAASSGSGCAASCDLANFAASRAPG